MYAEPIYFIGLDGQDEPVYRSGFPRDGVQFRAHRAQGGWRTFSRLEVAAFRPTVDVPVTTLAQAAELSAMAPGRWLLSRGDRWWIAQGGVLSRISNAEAIDLFS